MSNLGLALGVWTPARVAEFVKRYNSATSAPVSSAIVQAGRRQLVGIGTPTSQSLGSNSGLALAIGGALLALLALRVAAAWYVGKQFGRPVSGAVVGGVFGAPGLGVLSLFPSRTARPNALARRRKRAI